jgi:hypothetical protein
MKTRRLKKNTKIKVVGKVLTVEKVIVKVEKVGKEY